MPKSYEHTDGMEVFLGQSQESRPNKKKIKIPRKNDPKKHSTLFFPGNPMSEH